MREQLSGNGVHFSKLLKKNIIQNDQQNKAEQ
jgi:hypothetical protein